MNQERLNNPSVPAPDALDGLVAMYVDAAGVGHRKYVRVDANGSLATTAVINLGTMSLGAVTLAAGSAVAGKFGIDQTTPGATNGVVVNSGTVTIAGTASVAGSVGITGYAQGATTVGETGVLTFAAASTAPPALTAGNSYPPSLTLGGALRVEATATGLGAMTAVPTATANGAALGTMPTGGKGARLYLPTGASVTFTIAATAPGSPPLATFTASQATTGSNWDEPLAAGQMIYVTAQSGSPLFRWL